MDYLDLLKQPGPAFRLRRAKGVASPLNPPPGGLTPWNPCQWPHHCLCTRLVLTLTARAKTEGSQLSWPSVCLCFMTNGQAMGSNPLAIIIPCHRVVAGDGGLGGFGGGLDMKRQLLGIEGCDGNQDILSSSNSPKIR